MELWPGVHRIESEFNGNALCMYLLRGADRTILIDSGILSTPHQVIFPYLEHIGCSPSDIDSVIVTHASADHFGGNPALRASAPDIRIIAHRLDVRSITDIEHHLDENFTDAASLGCPWPAEVFTLTRELFGPPILVDWIVEGSESLDLGDGWSVTLLHTPGHTPGHLSMWDPRHQAFIVGDAILGNGVTSLVGQLVSPPPYFDVGDYVKTLSTAQELKPACLLATHYPIMCNQDVDRFLSESRDFVRRCDEALLAALRDNGSLTLCAAVDVLEDRVGPPGAVWRLTARAHLNALVSAHRVDLNPRGEIACWTLARRD